VLDGDEKPVSVQHDAETELSVLVALLTSINFLISSADSK
jgi:hypothetical protein